MNPTMTADASSDAQLVEAARRQEPGAYGELFRRWYDRSYDVALNILRDREAAADVAQDAFLVGWERLMDLRDPDAFGGWILRTTRNRALNRVTRDRHRTMAPIEEHHEETFLPDPDADPALHAERSDQRRLIWTAVAALGERDTSLLDLHLRHGLDPAEIAEELRITPNNASQLLFRLRRKLREAIGAVLLWRDGHPTCSALATLLAEAGPFDTHVAATIRRHQRDCNECLRVISQQTNPERLFASVPFAVAPLLFKEKAAAALAQAGVPMAPPAAIAAASPAAAGLRVSGRVAAGVVTAAVALAVVTAVVLWPSGPNGPSTTRAQPGPPQPVTVSTPPEVIVVPTGLATTGLPTTGLPTTGLSTTGLSTTGLPTTGTVIPATPVPVIATTAPDAEVSHAPRKPRVTRKPTHTPAPPRPPIRNPQPGPPTGPGGGHGCHHHHHGPGPWPWPWPGWCSPCPWGGVWTPPPGQPGWYGNPGPSSYGPAGYPNSSWYAYDSGFDPATGYVSP